MGRWAFFNTGFEYKFAFGSQSSDDIRIFGGINNNDYDDPQHGWTSSLDLDMVKQRLETVAEITSNTLPDWDTFEKNRKGTEDLREYLREYGDKKEHGKFSYTFFLGCLIYHQLLYTPKLCVRYEL